MKNKSLVLDTHIWIWSVNGDQNLSPAARERIGKCLGSSAVLIPAISIWELTMLWRKGRVQLTVPVRQWIDDALDKSGFCLAPLNDAVAIESALLPGQFHTDPADCMIVATARIEDAVLLTRDARMLDYGKAGYLEVLPA